MTKAEQIYEKHIGSNADLGYIPAIKQDILDAINEALSQHDVIKNEVSVCEHRETENLYCEIGWSIEGKRCKKCKQTVL